MIVVHIMHADVNQTHSLQTHSLQAVGSSTKLLVLIPRGHKWRTSKSQCDSSPTSANNSPPQATSAFPELDQSASLKPTIKPLSDSLIKHNLLQHKDKDIRLLVAICFCEVIQFLVPNPDFSTAVFKDILKFFLGLFAELADTESTYFSRRLKELEIVAKLKFRVLIFDKESVEKMVGPMRKTIVPNSWTSDPTDAFLSKYEVAFIGQIIIIGALTLPLRVIPHQPNCLFPCGQICFCS
ncbi:sister chromatid cohesion protein PDS5 homolog B-like [Actinidia eriantha]|uniref:sister chromatid cohesion protein PDS5 homolog B-like n=1 Tax=Actinidia eriantha TaxID=165200 RepID=UPI00258900D5|nr:sister chromatid cohesion protein PDS5 homolog B-like [Actinidia eriantha]